MAQRGQNIVFGTAGLLQINNNLILTFASPYPYLVPTDSARASFVTQQRSSGRAANIRIHAMLSYTDGRCFTWHHCDPAWAVDAG